MSIKQIHPYYTLVRDDGVDRMNEYFPASAALDRQVPLTRSPVTQAQYLAYRRRFPHWGPEQRRLFHDAYYIVDEPKMEPTSPGILRTIAAKVFRVLAPEPQPPEPPEPKRGSTFFTRP